MQQQQQKPHQLSKYDTERLFEGNTKYCFVHSYIVNICFSNGKQLRLYR